MTIDQRDHMIEQVAKAMSAKRRELIARPIADIWPELATTAIEALRESSSVDQMRSALQATTHDLNSAISVLSAAGIKDFADILRGNLASITTVLAKAAPVASGSSFASGDVPNPHEMTEDRAHEIVAAINSRATVTLGLEVPLGCLGGVSLAEMLEAKVIVEAKNERAAANAKANGGSYSISMVPDDRLIAAAYCFDHYPTSNEAILCVPRPSFNGTHAALGLVAITPDEGESDDEA